MEEQGFSAGSRGALMRKAMFAPIEEDKVEQRLEGTQTLETDLGLNPECTIGFSQLKVTETNFSRVIQKGASLVHRAWVCSQNRQRAAPGTRETGGQWDCLTLSISFQLFLPTITLSCNRQVFSTRQSIWQSWIRTFRVP